MRPATIWVGLLAAAGCDGLFADHPSRRDAGSGDAAGGACAELLEEACLARADCHAGYLVSPCRNILGYCAQWSGCEDGQANCVGPASCEIVEPFCAGPYVNSYVGLCYGLCARADQCAGCQDAKMAFTQATGCVNDGSVEFCIPPVLDHVFPLIAPTVTCAPGGGRAGCDPATQLLCQFPTAGAACTAPHGALTDEAWDTLCGISMLPDVTAIVPTFAE